MMLISRVDKLFRVTLKDQSWDGKKWVITIKFDQYLTEDQLTDLQSKINSHLSKPKKETK